MPMVGDVDDVDLLWGNYDDPTCRGAVGVFCPPGVSTWSGVNGEGLSKKGVNTKQNPKEVQVDQTLLLGGIGNP